MFCDKCPHQAEINAALAPCQECEHAHFHDRWGYGDNGDPACQTCENLKKIEKAMRPCGACEAGKLHGQISTDASEAGVLAFQRAVENFQCPADGVTDLPPDVEDALRKVLFVLFDFEPIELLLIQHVCHGRNVGTFREPLAELKERLNTRYDLSEGSTNFRATAHEWKKAIVRKFPPIAPFFAAVTDANAGSCRR